MTLFFVLMILVLTVLFMAVDRDTWAALCLVCMLFGALVVMHSRAPLRPAAKSTNTYQLSLQSEAETKRMTQLMEAQTEQLRQQITDLRARLEDLHAETRILIQSQSALDDSTVCEYGH